MLHYSHPSPKDHSREAFYDGQLEPFGRWGGKERGKAEGEGEREQE